MGLKRDRRQEKMLLAGLAGLIGVVAGTMLAKALMQMRWDFALAALGTGAVGLLPLLAALYFYSDIKEQRQCQEEDNSKEK